MNQMVTVGEQRIAIKQFKGQRVVTFKDVDTVHGRASGTASRNFRANREHFIEEKDFFKIQSDEIRRVGITSPNGGYVLTESGYLMLVKSMTDDKAWQVQRMLVENYFHAQFANSTSLSPEALTNLYRPKYWKGRQVVTLRDICELTGVKRSTLFESLKAALSGMNRVEAEMLTDEALQQFRQENPECVEEQCQSLWILSESGVRKISQQMNGKNLTMRIWNRTKTVPVMKPSKLMTYTDALSSAEAQEYIAWITKAMTGLEVAMAQYNRHQAVDASNQTKGVIMEMASVIYEYAFRINRLEIPTIQGT